MNDSSIQKFYKNQTVFLTGATGFLGKQVVTKLLTSCYDVKKIYLLIREKKGKTPEERLDAILDSFAFHSLRKQFPHFKSKLGIIKGDCELPQLGISGEDEKVLKKEVTCIIHVSATVRFDENLKTAAHINVRAVQDLVNFAKEMDNLKAFVYVSTAYSNCNRKNDIKEKFYDPPMTSTKLFQLVDGIDHQHWKILDNNLLADWPNTYTFTKAIGENVIKEEGKNLPIAIVRPAIVLGAVKEPEPGYFDTIQGITALSLGVYLGLIRVLFTIKEKRTFILPSDYVANNILAAAWHLYKEKPETIPIYNYIGSHKQQVTWDMYTSTALRIGRTNPTMCSLWYPFLIKTDNKVLFEVCQFLLHTLPAFLADLVLSLIGKKPTARRIYKKIEKNLQLVIPFTTNTWDFDTFNVDRLWEQMSESDKKIFNFNMDNLDWTEYIRSLTNMARLHVIKDPVDTVQKAKRKQVLFIVIHYFFVALLLLLFCKLLFAVFNLGFSWFNSVPSPIFKQKFDAN